MHSHKQAKIFSRDDEKGAEMTLVLSLHKLKLPQDRVQQWMNRWTSV